MIDFKKKFRRLLPLRSDQITPEHDTDISHYADLPEGYYGTNPSVLPVENGYIICIRALNYTHNGPNIHQRTLTAGERFRTVNRFVLVDEAFQLRNTLPALNDYFDDIEDIKLFMFNGSVMGVGSFVDPAHGGDVICTALLSIDPGFDRGRYTLIASPFGLRREKNWAPFVHNNAIHFVYSFDPFIVVRYDSGTGKVFVADPCFSKYDAAELSFLLGGSSAGLAVPGGFLFVAHRRRVGLPRLRFSYVSRLYFLRTAAMTLTASRFFTIGPATIQFINGLARAEDDFVFSYGQLDRSARVCRVAMTRLALPTS